MFDELDDDPKLDLTPLIDVIFMLVIFFVMTMTFSKPVLDVMLPKSSEAQVQKKGPELLLSVKADGTLWFEGEELALESLPELLDKRSEEMLNLFIDEKAPFESFVKIVDIAKAKRSGKFVISTRREGAS